jgi:hypothetical protein
MNYSSEIKNDIIESQPMNAEKEEGYKNTA